MKITFDYSQIQSSQDQKSIKTSATQDQTKSSQLAGAFNLQITGQSKDGEAYTDHSKTADTINSHMEMDGSEVQQMYMAVMSNSMSSEDFSKMMKKGYDPTDTDVETSSTILDSIKIAMAKGGTNVTGFTDTVSEDTLEKEVGSTSYAEALKEAQTLQKPDDSQITYMVDNQMQPTIGNLYKAQFSTSDSTQTQSSGYYADSTDGYYARKAETVDINQISDQVDHVISNAGMEVDDTSRSTASFLLNNGLPLTEDNMVLCSTLQNIQLPMQQTEVTEKIQAATSSGKDPLDTDLSKSGTLYDQAVETLKSTQAVSDQAVQETVAGNLTLNLRNLKASQKKIEAASDDTTAAAASVMTAAAAVQTGTDTSQTKQTGETGDVKILAQAITGGTSASLITARRQLAEVQLRMTSEANLKLLQSDYQIDTAPLEELVSQLKSAEQSWQSSDVVQAENASETISAMAALPAAIIGQVASGTTDFTVSSVSTAGTALQAQYEKASQSYETMMTSPRSDLGDSIQKAFQNTNEILSDLNLDTTDENQRAVRILGYNSMPITEENLVKVISADQTVQNVIQKVTPGKALSMIRNGINPLTTDMTELDQYLSSQETDLPEETEKYSSFLSNLEQSSNVTDQEKEAYIGIYRLFRQIEKSDGEAVGYLVNTGSEVNLGNLLSAVRTSKNKNMDYKVDDSFGGVSSVKQEASISDQINQINLIAAARQVWDNMTPENLSQMQPDETTTLQEMADYLGTAKSSQDTKEKESSVKSTATEKESTEYSEQIQQVQQAMSSAESVVDYLVGNGQQVSVNNLIACKELLTNRGSAFRKIANGTAAQETQGDNSGSDTGTDTVFDTAVNNLQNSFTDTDSAGEGYQEFQNSVNKILETQEDAENVTSVDVKALQSAYKQISLAAGLSTQENYEVPVKINGVYTSVNLTFIHGTGKSSVSASTSVGESGMMSAEFEMQSDGTLQTIMTAEKAEGVEYLNDLKQGLQDTLSQQGYQTSEIPVVKVTKVSLTSLQQKNKIADTSQETDGSEKISSQKLYQVAKAFLEMIRK